MYSLKKLGLSIIYLHIIMSTMIIAVCSIAYSDDIYIEKSLSCGGECQKLICVQPSEANTFVWGEDGSELKIVLFPKKIKHAIYSCQLAHSNFLWEPVNDKYYKLTKVCALLEVKRLPIEKTVQCTIKVKQVPLIKSSSNSGQQ